MQLILVQHGEAVAAEEDPNRPLTPLGRGDVERLGAFFTEHRIRVPRIVHSGKRRARDTAEMLAAAMAPPPEIAVIERMSPKDSPVWLAEAVAEWNEDTLIVSHQPFLTRFVARLVLSAEDPHVVEFTPGTALCVCRRAVSRAWVIDWLIPPTLLRR
jgi:phosphohistidine phosphatase